MSDIQYCDVNISRTFSKLAKEVIGFSVFITAVTAFLIKNYSFTFGNAIGSTLSWAIVLFLPFMIFMKTRSISTTLMLTILYCGFLAYISNKIPASIFPVVALAPLLYYNFTIFQSLFYWKQMKKIAEEKERKRQEAFDTFFNYAKANYSGYRTYREPNFHESYRSYSSSSYKQNNSGNGNSRQNAQSQQSYRNYKSGTGSTAPKEKSELEKAVEFFNLPANFTQAELKKKRNELLKKYHPDLGGSDEITKKINLYYELLSSK